ncbi:succinate dehydrogenase, hydrophobic membrane anchor protein [Telmatospirillum sp. J64-1]|uniref:succinate dehydrogenase, hydrophobic membrane anchor protein n=1 Tax=Telmatospirillum sp. J64-1 TaxID=2502183 RepID=UPI00115DCE55|nr:succinate dehydrogenase, hydrophobic membrane anchor protein [Telmatospirillum sp. J64-1]
MRSLRTPLGRVRGLGSAKEGVGHWWGQRLSGLALVPLTLWFVISVIGLIGADYATFSAWLGTPGNATMMLLLVFVVFYHAQLGLQVVIEDYVHNEGAKMASLIAIKFATVALGVFCAVSILKLVAFGG